MLFSTMTAAPDSSDRQSYLVRLLCASLLLVLSAINGRAQNWPQLGRTAQRTGDAAGISQHLRRVVGTVVVDPFADYATTVNGYLPVHYPVILVDGRDLFVIEKGGSYTPWSHWDAITWSIKKVERNQDNQLMPRWTTPTDWRPVPRLGPTGGPALEPPYQCLLTVDFVWAPGSGGTMLKLSRADGSILERINPFGQTIDPSIFAVGSPAVDQSGNLFYNAIRLQTDAWKKDSAGSWLVRVSSTGVVSIVSFSTLMADAPDATSLCTTTFDISELPWPPSGDAAAPVQPCGSQRPPIKSGIAVGTDGTIYTLSRAHFNERWGYLVAITPDLTLKWHVSLRNRFTDGCDVSLPPNGTPGGCRDGARIGVEPADNEFGSGIVDDDSTGLPVVASDGRVLITVATRYNYAGGHLMVFESDGGYVGAYPAGWDCTPAIYPHDGTYSIILKENHYGGIGSYCNEAGFCPSRLESQDPESPEVYYITQLNRSLQVEWQFRNETTESCRRTNVGLQCSSDHPYGFHWCVSAPAVDRAGVVYANNEDGYLYAIAQGGRRSERVFLESSRGAAYTPISIGGDGLVYVMNSGAAFLIGDGGRRRSVKH
jgi:hypothetical protein